MKTILLLALTGRCLAYNRIAGYEPQTVVIDQNNIDLDQRDIETQLSLGTDAGYVAAIKVYTEGAHCASYSTLNVQPLQASLNFGDLVSGLAQDGSMITATVMQNYPKGREEIEVLNTGNANTSSFCEVGGNPDPITDGCFADAGTLTIDDGDPNVNYTYSVLADTKNGITMQKLSTNKRQDTSYWCPECNSEDYNKFYRLYGEHDYADQWFTAARLGEKTDFYFGNADFGKYGLEGKVEAMTTATLVLHIWMHVIWLMEDAVGTCNPSVENSGIGSWDEAVAYYTGSMEGEDSGGRDQGFLLNELANRVCQSFKTCGRGGRAHDGEAFVNIQILEKFKRGLGALREGDCSLASNYKEMIAELMLVPLVQGMLLNGYSQYISAGGLGPAETAGATFAASVLPYVYHCSPEDATTILDLMGANSVRTGTDFPRVKQVLERNYECMGLRCSDIGGIWDSNTDAYYPHAEVCADGLSENDKMAIGIGLSVGSLMLLCLAMYIARKQNNHDLKLEGVLEDQEQDEDLQNNHDLKLEGVLEDEEQDELPELS